jgi:hypothetical protein
MPDRKLADKETLNLLKLLREPPVPDSPSIKTLIDILEQGGSLEDFHLSNSFDWLLSTGKFVLQNIQFLACIKDRSIASPIPTPTVLSSFKVPRELLRDLNAYLKKLAQFKDEHGNRCKPRDILALLPYWPYVLEAFNMMSGTATSNAKGWNKRRWANTLRHLQANDCPLGESTRRLAINQYRMALAISDDFKSFPRLIRGWKKRLGLPQNEKRGWAKIVKPLVNYLAPFYPAKRVGRRYVRLVKEHAHAPQREAISQRTFQEVANILHLAYPIFWPQVKPNRVRLLFHAP